MTYTSAFGHIYIYIYIYIGHDMPRIPGCRSKEAEAMRGGHAMLKGEEREEEEWEDVLI